MRGRRGSALLVCLLLTVTLFVLGMGFLSQHTSARLASRRATLAAQSRELARSGLDNVRAKWCSDIQFPPAGSAEGRRYVYSEMVYAADGVTAVGSYEVTLDAGLMAPPYEVMRVWSLGFVGSRTAPESSMQIYAELDVARQDRAVPAQPNPMLGQWVNFVEQPGETP